MSERRKCIFTSIFENCVLLLFDFYRCYCYFFSGVYKITIIYNHCCVYIVWDKKFNVLYLLKLNSIIN